MNVRAFVLFLILILAGGVSPSLMAAVKAPTLEGDPRLPGDQIEDLCSAEQWKVLRAVKYRALVILDAQIRSDGSMTDGTVRTSEPDATWTKPARDLAKKVRLKATSTGTHILADGIVFVIFYGQGPDRVALVYARQEDDPHPSAHGRPRYIAIEKY
jgi:hypothetical protein